MKKELKIGLTELPLRTERLSSSQISEIFGGASHCQHCHCDEECGDMYCRGNDSNGYYCINWGEYSGICL